MAEVDDVSISDMEFYKSSAISCKPKGTYFPVIVPGDNFHQVDIKPNESGGWKKKYLKGQLTPRKKKELYIKLDEILLGALSQEFEMCPGHTIDRLEMIEFLTSVVHQHLSECPDLKKVLDLRDTVLTGRVKKAFPEVEYKRKQMRQDHYRKAWLYVNIRRKPKTPDHSPAKPVTNTTSAWTQLTTPGLSTPLNRTSSSPSSPIDEDQLPTSSFSYTNALYDSHCSPTPLVGDETGAMQNEGSPQSVSDTDGVMSSFGGQYSCGNQPGERTGLELDTLTLQKWVVSHYLEDSMSYVPVQDVVKAFKMDYNVDISYKECHQMILSAFTSPRNRLIPRKTVRVSSLGQQYVYRGIAPINKATCAMEESQDADGSECAQPNCQSENLDDENEETWRQRIRDITDERDQALMERNQALAALMDLEKEHAEAKRTIESLRNETLSNRGEELKTNHCEGFSLGNLLQTFGDAKREGKRDTVRDGKRDTVRDGKRDSFADQVEKTVRNNEECDYSLWKEVVTQAKEERDHLLKRLEIVKSERDSYLERLHSLEKENQRLRDAVSVRHSNLSQNRLLDNISRHFQTNCCGENHAKEARSSVLSHLRSKRKQVTPSRLNKSPKFENSNLDELHLERSSFDDQRANSGDCPSPVSPMDSGVASPGNPATSNGVLFSKKERLCNGDASKRSDNTKGNVGGTEQESSGDFLVFTSGSGMIGFTRHPLED